MICANCKYGVKSLLYSRCGKEIYYCRILSYPNNLVENVTECDYSKPL